MHFTSIRLDAYGSMEDSEFLLSPGFQVLCGQDAQTIAAIQHFLADMLYGRHKNPTRNLPESGGSTVCGGRLKYTLDDEREFEIRRNFDSTHRNVTIWDYKRDRDVTTEYQRLKNCEPSIGEQHLHIGKALFIHAATIGPLSPDDHGNDALDKIRETLLSLADSAETSGTAEHALKVLGESASETGRVSRIKKLLLSARARLEALETERARSRDPEIAMLENELAAALDRLARANQEKETLENELRRIDTRSRAQRLKEAEKLQVRIDEVTQSCFALSSAREFPLELSTEVQRAANAVATATAQVDRTTAEHAEVMEQLLEESALLDADGTPQVIDVPETTEQELATLESRLLTLRERVDALNLELNTAQQRFARAQADLQRLPDFSRLGADPVAWLTQLAASFRAAIHARSTAIENAHRMQGEIERRKRAIAGPAALFAEFSDFTSEARAHEMNTALYEEQSTILVKQIEELTVESGELHSKLPATIGLAGTLAAVAILCGVIALLREMVYVFIPAALFAGASVVMFVQWFWSRHSLREIGEDAAIARAALEELKESHRDRQSRMNAVIQKAGYESLREIEALYDRYLRDTADLDKYCASYEQMAREAQEEIEHVSRLFKRLQETFESLDVTVSHEDDIEPAASRAITRYQEYRDAKRRLNESRDKPSQIQKELSEAQREFEQVQREEIERALAMRELLRNAGFREESRYTAVLAAVQAYRVRTAQVREKLGRVALMRERAHTLEVRLDAERRDLARQSEILNRKLAAGGVDSLEKWNDLAKRAEQYRKAWDERARLQERLDNALRGETIDALRATADDRVFSPAQPSRSEEEVNHDLERVTAQIESATTEAHDAQIQLTRRVAGQRSLNEIDEDYAVTEARVAELELELEATAFALSLMEEAARDRRVRVAPRVAALAGKYLNRITNGVHSQVTLSRDFKIAVTTPQTALPTSDDTVQQIHLALRLALVQTLTANGEHVPILLDDPFANCNETWLTNAIELFSELGQTHQILLFTSRGEVARAASRLSVPVINLRQG